MIKTRYYLAYGSNLNRSQMSYRCPWARVAGASELKGYEMIFRGVATVEPKEGGSVPVLLWKITPQDERALDFYEGYPRLYRKEMVEVELKGKTITAMAYMMNEGPSLCPPNKHYYDVIREGYKAAGFDVSILDKAVERTTELIYQEELKAQEAFSDASAFENRFGYS